MSEYQYYEFQAIDRPLTDEEMAEMGAVSSRATITPTRFVNSYSWGDFKGDPARWMERWFDAFLYLANWGTRDLMLRFPRAVLDPDLARRYCPGDPASVTATEDFVVLHFRSEEEGGDGEWIDDDNALLALIIPVRAEIATGDHRALYLAWLLCAEYGELDDDEVEPPVPAGLGTLSASLQAFADFLRLDPDLIAAAAERSEPARPDVDAGALREWIGALPDAAKTGLLTRVAEGAGLAVRAELIRSFRASLAAESAPAAEPRTVQELLAAAEALAETRICAERERAARAREKREREEAAARERRLEELAARGNAAWSEVDELIALKKPDAYDRAVQLLMDLRELAARGEGTADVEARIAALRARNSTKRSFLERLARAGKSR